MTTTPEPSKSSRSSGSACRRFLSSVAPVSAICWAIAKSPGATLARSGRGGTNGRTAGELRSERRTLQQGDVVHRREDVEDRVIERALPLRCRECRHRRPVVEHGDLGRAGGHRGGERTSGSRIAHPRRIAQVARVRVVAQAGVVALRHRRVKAMHEIAQPVRGAEVGQAPIPESRTGRAGSAGAADRWSTSRRR